MALATNVAVEHLPLGERPQYGMPYPEGIAVASSAAPDDASGGSHTFSFNSDPGFLYRFELFNWTRGEATTRDLHLITVHRWAAGKHAGDAAAFDLNWDLSPHIFAGTATIYTISGGGNQEMPRQLTRFAMGHALGGGAPGVSRLLLFATNEANTNTITNEVSAVWTYWRKEALYLPGFLSSFYEAPAVPPLIRGRS